MNNKQPAKWVRVGGRGEKGGRETIRMTDKDKGKEGNTVYQGKGVQSEEEKEGEVWRNEMYTVDKRMENRVKGESM